MHALAGIQAFLPLPKNHFKDVKKVAFFSIQVAVEDGGEDVHENNGECEDGGKDHSKVEYLVSDRYVLLCVKINQPSPTNTNVQKVYNLTKNKIHGLKTHFKTF